MSLNSQPAIPAEVSPSPIVAIPAGAPDATATSSSSHTSDQSASPPSEEFPRSSLQVWYCSPSALIQPISDCNELQVLTEGRMKELAVVAMQTATPQACNVLSPESTWLVALPVIALPTSTLSSSSSFAGEPASLGCLIAMTHAAPDTSPVQAMLSRLMPIQQMSVRVAGQLSNLSSHATASAAEHLGHRPISESSTWGQLAGATGAKLRNVLAKRAVLGIGVLTAVALLLIGAIPLPYRVRCEVTCEPSKRRFVAAPFDSTLIKSYVSLGQHVQAGELLAMLDGRELRSQLAALQAEYAQEIQQRLASLRTRDHAEAELARLRSEKLAHEIQVIEQKLAALEIRSPLDGIIVSGDLERVEGVPVKVGETLFEIGHLDKMLAELHIPEAQVTDVQVGSNVVVTLDSLGGQPIRTSIESVHPRSELLGTESVFVAQAQLPTAALELKPGMHGLATISAGNRSIAWLLLHRPYYRVRQFLGW